MCGISTSLWLALILIVMLAACAFKMKGLIKKFLPEPGPDNGFVVFIVFAGIMLFAAISVAQFAGEHDAQIVSFFTAIRESCEPPKDERSPEQYIDEELQKLKDKQ
jgi:hypothetical protein